MAAFHARWMHAIRRDVMSGVEFEYEGSADVLSGYFTGHAVRSALHMLATFVPRLRGEL